VAVTTPGGTNANTAGDDYTYFPTPTVTGLNPAGGPEAGGNNVTITGTGFTGATSVVFGSSGATNVVVMNDTTITVDAPAGTNTAAVRVGTPGGSSANTPADFYTYAPVPTVTGVSPASGGTAGGTTVTVTGTGFRVGGVNVVTQVTFGGTVAVCNAPIIETEVTCTSPNHAPGPVTVTVTTYGGSSPSNAPSDLFVYTV